MTVDHQGGDAPGQAASAVDAAVDAPPAEAEPAPSAGRRERVGTALARLVDVIRTGDDKAVEQAVLDLSRRRRWLAPLGLIVGAFVMLFQGLKLLFTNWRLTLVQIVPAMWIWLALLDLKIHTLHGKEFHVISRPRPDPVRAGGHRPHRRQLLPQCGLRLRHFDARQAPDPPGVRSGPPPPPGDTRLGLRRRPRARPGPR